MKKPVEVWRWKRYPEKFGCKMYVYTPPPQGWRGVHDGKNITNHGVQSYYRPGELDLKGIEPLAFRTRVTEKSCHAKRTLYH